MSAPRSVVVAMSGGVDSSVAALLMKRSGVETIGVSMQVWDYRNHGGSASRATCCAPSDFCDARMVAAALEIPFYVFDFEESFREQVIARFIDDYRRGQTPNPCVECNSKIKFAELRRRAGTLGVRDVATGHYARIEVRDGRHRLLRGRDVSKDQSYFLYRMQASELPHTHFPVGSMNKAEVRELAREHGLVTANKAESQDICFVSGSIRDFLTAQGEKLTPGNVVSHTGEVLGQHDGAQQFTVGQRRGVGVRGQSSSLYVLEVDPTENRVVVGPRSELERERFVVRDLHWVDAQRVGAELNREVHAIAQLRHRHAGVPVRIVPRSDGRAEVFFTSTFSLPTPGQAAVFYDAANEELLGGGTIDLSRKDTAQWNETMPIG